MHKVFVSVILFFIFLVRSSAVAQHQYAFQITFTDKNNTPYSLASPSAYLSTRAIARRTIQGIAIDSSDLPVNSSYVDSVINLTHGIFHETSRWLNMCMILLSDSSQILNLAAKPFISDVKLVGYFDSGLHYQSSYADTLHTVAVAHATADPDASYYGYSWLQTHMVNGNYLHDKGFKGQGKLIAVLDAGFDFANSHPGFDSLWSSGRVIDMHDFVYHDTTVFTQNQHGGWVLSTMAGYIADSFVGTAPLAMYALYNTEYVPNEQLLELDNFICGAERADSVGADIITASLGYTLFNYPKGAGLTFSDLDGTTTIAAKAANIATKKGILFVTAAGNLGEGSSLGTTYWGTHIGTPADADSALTIGGLNEVGVMTAFSSYGPNAASVIKPDVCALADQTNVFSVNSYSSGSGTSFATPQIAGWAACLWQANPNATPYQIRQAIIRCASLFSDPGPQTGYGVPDFECAAQSMLSVKNVAVAPTSANWILAAPNPFADELKLSVFPAASGTVSFAVMDITGRVLCTWQQYISQGSNALLTVPVSNFQPGIYLLKAVSGDQQQIIKLEKN